MLQLSNISKQYADRVLFSSASLTINSGERVALFGRNGSGKSTLLKIICGDESVDSGEVVTPKGYRIGFLRQHLSFSKSTVIEEVCSAAWRPRFREIQGGDRSNWFGIFK